MHENTCGLKVHNLQYSCTGCGQVAISIVWELQEGWNLWDIHIIAIYFENVKCCKKLVVDPGRTSYPSLAWKKADVMMRMSLCQLSITLSYGRTWAPGWHFTTRVNSTSRHLNYVLLQRARELIAAGVTGPEGHLLSRPEDVRILSVDWLKRIWMLCLISSWTAFDGSRFEHLSPQNTLFACPAFFESGTSMTSSECLEVRIPPSSECHINKWVI